MDPTCKTHRPLFAISKQIRAECYMSYVLADQPIWFAQLLPTLIKQGCSGSHSVFVATYRRRNCPQVCCMGYFSLRVLIRRSLCAKRLNSAQKGGL